MKKRVLIVNNTMGRAGAEKALAALLKTINPNDFDIDFLSIVNRGEMFQEMPEYVNILNKSPSCESLMTVQGKMYLIRTVLGALLYKGYIFRHFIYLVRNFYLQVKRGRLMFDKLFWHALSVRQPVLKTEYDLAIAYTEGASNYYVADRTNAKKKASFIQVDYSRAGYIKALDKKYYEKMDAVFLVSQSVKDSFQQVYPEYANKLKTFQCVLLPQEIIDASKNGQGFNDAFDGVRILTVARLHPQKALDIAVPAFAKMSAAHRGRVRWYIIGEGDERSRLEKLIAEHKVQDSFILLGESANPYPHLSECDIYVQATHFEGWSLSLASALIFNRPSIVSNVAGNREQITNEETGIIIDLSEDNLANALNRLVSDPLLRGKFSENLSKNDVDYAKDIRLIYELLDTPYERRVSLNK